MSQNRGSGAVITTTTFPAKKPDEDMIELDDDSDDLEIDEEAIKAVLAMPSSPERAPTAQSARQSSALASANASKSVPNFADRAKSAHGARYNDLFNGRLSVLD